MISGRPLLTDRARVERLLSGEERFKEGEYKPLRALLELIATWAQKKCQLTPGEQRRIERRKREEVMSCTANLGMLMKLETYCRDLEKSIEKKLQYLGTH